MQADVPLTDRQMDAYAWLSSVGKATVSLLRANGFRQSTFDTLVDIGCATKQQRPQNQIPYGSYTVYLAVHDPLNGGTAETVEPQAIHG